MSPAIARNKSSKRSMASNTSIMPHFLMALEVLLAFVSSCWSRPVSSASLLCYPLHRMAAKPRAARRWFIHGRVQGVGFRYFAQRAALELGLSGYVRNLEDGGVEAYASGAEEQLSRFAALLRRGPRLAEVRAVEERTAEPSVYSSFEIEG